MAFIKKFKKFHGRYKSFKDQGWTRLKGEVVGKKSFLKIHIKS